MRRWLSDEKNANILASSFAFGIPFGLVFQLFKDEHFLVRWLLLSYCVVTLTLIIQHVLQIMRRAKSQSCPPDVAK